MTKQARELAVSGLIAQAMFLRILCIIVLCGILVAGLWPFHAPKNEVSWLNNGNGLLFGEYGSIVSAGAFKSNESKAGAPCSLEIWLQPSLVDYSGTILAFYWPQSLVVPLKLRQSLGDVVIERTTLDRFQHTKRTHIYVDDVFSHAKPVFLTFISGELGTTAYVDGAPVKKISDFRFSSQDLTGQFIIGNTSTTTDNWSGQLKGVAIYDRELAPDEVSQHYRKWTINGQPVGAKSEGVVALYLFNEAIGNVIHNQVASTTDLLIPERFFVLREQFFEVPWSEFHSDWSYWKDVGINITGFIPLGFFFRAYLDKVGGIKRATWVTIGLGFTISLIIEFLQAFLPTRNSGMTDLITNTSGTALGAILCAWSMEHNWFPTKQVS